jgi:hypothetical protein
VSQQQQIQIDPVEIDGLSETFADSFTGIHFDGQSWRIELCVTRTELPNPPKPLRAKRVPVCRLVLTPQLGFELTTKLTALIAQLEKQGVIKKTVAMPPTSSKPN